MPCELDLEMEEVDHEIDCELDETVKIDDPKKIIPLMVSENGTYVGEENVGYSPVEVKIRDIKSLIEVRGGTQDLFKDCVNIESVDDLISYKDTENSTNMKQMFYRCLKIKSLPLLDTRKVVNMNYFAGFSGVTEIPLYDTRNVEDFGYAFAYCYGLKRISALDCRSATNMHTLAAYAPLTELLIRNIKISIQVGSGQTWGHLLTVDSLIHLIKELRDTGSLLTLTVGSVNLAKLANVYVRLVDITDEMRAEDDLIDEKLPFEVCESTDEGACLITDYVNAKNWEIQ